MKNMKGGISFSFLFLREEGKMKPCVENKKRRVKCLPVGGKGRVGERKSR